MKTLLPILLLGFTSMAWAAPAAESAARPEMAKLAWLAGNWAGEGWIIMGAQGRQEFTQTEKIEHKLGGLVVVIEGRGTSKADGSVVHDALAFVSYDDRAKTFRWRAFTADGRQTDTVATVGTNTLAWELEIPQVGRMRYTLALTEKGEWFEIGEMTRDGQTWRKFFEMTLRRQP